jgi:putative spermidine/putrescine transport system ATP-binding protein
MAATTTGQFTTIGLRGVTRAFGSQVALDDLDLDLTAGEFVCLLGPSGCGKSTALNCLAGLLPLTAGAIWMDEQRIDGVPPERRGFGMVFQNYALFPHLSVHRNVEFGLKMRGVGKEERTRRVEQALTMVQLTEHAHKHPSQLSGGQQQRVAISRAIVMEPRLVLMDEPLSNLDAKLRIEMRSEIRRIHQELSLTTVYVTHDQAEALSMADRLVVLRAGNVEQVGTPEELYTQPSSAYVAGFMGYRNLLNLQVEDIDGARAVVTGPSLRLEGHTLDVSQLGPAVVAIRPEDFVVGESNGNGTDAVVKVVEYQGREMLVEADLRGGQTVHFRTDKRLTAGDRVSLRVEPERVLVYAGE